MAWRGLHISRPCRLTQRYRQICVDIDETGETLGFPVEDVAWIILDTPQVLVSGSLLSILAESGVVIVVPDAKHHPAGLLLPFHQHHAQAAIAHLQVSMSLPLKKRLWQRLVRAKLENQAAVLSGIGSDGASVLLAMSSRVRSGDMDNREAQGARFYWQRLFTDFRRHEGDRRNGLLNYGYAIVRAALARACAASGLLPAFGVHHCSRTNPFNLVDDLLEPFRPLVDRLARARATALEGNDLNIEDRRFMASILSESVALVDDRMSVLAATEAVAASLVRTISSGDPTRLNIPTLLAD
ncbi:type II CRISPR-associated endonuclease Cas1 [Sphingomonas sp. 3-13AW]|uniref:type II CRISPR-associated endonuclease Cas1 n=1 Tax=Sphingomonas sp. 3-13AW TaxID=3050450 RepID=UPI003BB7BE73